MRWEWNRTILKSFAIGLVVVVLYVLSIGPVFKLAGGWHMPQERLSHIGLVYAPIWWGMEQSKPCEGLMLGYLVFWNPEVQVFGRGKLPAPPSPDAGQTGGHYAALDSFFREY